MAKLEKVSENKGVDGLKDQFYAYLRKSPSASREEVVEHVGEVLPGNAELGELFDGQRLLVHGRILWVIEKYVRERGAIAFEEVASEVKRMGFGFTKELYEELMPRVKKHVRVPPEDKSKGKTVKRRKKLPLLAYEQHEEEVRLAAVRKRNAANAIQREVIGAVLLMPAMMEEVRAVITSNDFSVLKSRTCFSCMEAMHDEGLEIDALVLLERLEDSGQYRAGEGAVMLLHCITKTPDARKAEDYAILIKGLREFGSKLDYDGELAYSSDVGVGKEAETHSQVEVETDRGITPELIVNLIKHGDLGTTALRKIRGEAASQLTEVKESEQDSSESTASNVGAEDEWNVAKLAVSETLVNELRAELGRMVEEGGESLEAIGRRLNIEEPEMLYRMRVIGTATAREFLSLSRQRVNQLCKTHSLGAQIDGQKSFSVDELVSFYLTERDPAYRRP